MSLPPGRPCFSHLHLKQRLPHQLFAEAIYELQATCTNEMDMWDSGDTAEWGNALPVVTIQVLNVRNGTHSEPPTTPTALTATNGMQPTSTSTSSSSSLSFSSPSPPPSSLVRLTGVSGRFTPDCKPLLSRGGKVQLKFVLTPSPVLLARQLALIPPNQVLSHPFFIHFSVTGPLGARLLPTISGPHVLINPSPKAGKGAQSASQDKLTYVMGEHGVHHAFFVPLDCNANNKSTSVFSFPANLSATETPTFVRVKEILGVNLGGRIWDCGLLLFQYLREVVLLRDPDYFLGRKILEVGSGTGIVGLWLWAYVIGRNKRRRIEAEKSGARKPTPPQTTFLLTDQEEAMDNLRDNLGTNLDLLTGGAHECESVHIEASQLGWGDENDHQALAIPPTPEPFDLILASDVVFNPIYFTPLLETLQFISGPKTRVIMAYRPRAADKRQDEVFFRGLIKYGWTCKKEGKYEDVFMLTLDRAENKDAANASSSPSPSPQPSASPPPSQSQSPPPSNSTESTSTAPSSNDSGSSSTTTTAVASVESNSSPQAATITSNHASSTATDGPSIATAPSASIASTSTPVSAALPSSASISQSPSSSTSDSPPTDIDPFAQVYSFDALAMECGAIEGAADALKQMEADGLFAGERKGEQIAGEFGFYFGFLHMCTLLKEKHPSAYSERVWNRCAKLHASILESPLYQSSFDPQLMEDGSFLLKIRNGFKALMTQMGVWEQFKQQAAAAEAQQMNF